MTISSLALAAKKVIDAAWLHGDAYDLSSQAAFALESTQMLQSSETAAEHTQLRDDIAGACLARWEEEQDNARLRLALKSAQRGRRELRARVAELEQQLADEPLPIALTAKAAESVDKLTALLAPTQALREDSCDGPPHHDYRLGRELPQIGGA